MYRSETPFTKLWCQAWENWIWSRGTEVERESLALKQEKGICYHWKEKVQCSRGDKCSFRHESHDRAKPTPEVAPSSEPPTPGGRSALRKRSLRGRSQFAKSKRQTCKNLFKGLCTKLPCDYWHPFCKSKSGCKFGAECSFPHWKVQEQPNKRQKKGGDNSAAAIVKSVRQLSCVTGHWAARFYNDLSEGHKSFGTNSTSKSFAASSKHPRKQRSIAE